MVQKQNTQKNVKIYQDRHVKNRTKQKHSEERKDIPRYIDTLKVEKHGVEIEALRRNTDAETGKTSSERLNEVKSINQIEQNV